MLTRSWLREFDRNWRDSNVPEERARARELRLQGVKRWKLPWVVALLPLVIQASLGLFFVALILMLFDLHRPTAYFTLVILGTGMLFYLSTSVISALDTNAPFTSPVSKALRVLIDMRWSQLHQILSLMISRLIWRPGGTTCIDADDAQVIWPTQGTETRLAIYNRLYAATSKAVENLPVFTALFDQWVHTPRLRPRSLTHWRPILPLIQPYLSNSPLSKDFGLRSVARLFLCFDLKEEKGKQAVIEALGENDGDTPKPSSIDQLYIHLLHQPDPDWSLACQVVLKLESDSGTITELRWILNWITFRFLNQGQEFPNERDSSWVSSMRNIIPFLCSTAIYIFQNKIVNDDHRLFDLLLIVTRSIADGLTKVDRPRPSTKLRGSQTSSEGIYEGLFVSVRDFLVPPESQWEFIRDLYAASSSSAAGTNRDFTLLVILLMISTLSAAEYSHVDASITYTYDPFINLKKDLPVLMDGLCEMWQANHADHYLLTGIAVWLLNQSCGSFRKPSPDAQQSSFQELLNAYDSYTSGAMPLATSGAHQFIGAVLSFSLKLFNWGMKWQPQTLELKNPWLVMHIHNILRCEWRIPESAMREAAWGRFEHPNSSDWLGQIERLDLLDLLERLDLLDHEVDQVDHLLDHQVDHLLDHLLDQRIDQQIKQLGQARQLFQLREQLPQQRLQEVLQQVLQKFYLQHDQLCQMLHQMLPEGLRYPMPELLQQLLQLQNLFPQLKQKLEQRLEQREQEFGPQREQGCLQALAQVFQHEGLQEAVQAFLDGFLPLPPPNIAPDPPLLPLDPPLLALPLDPPLLPLPLDPPLLPLPLDPLLPPLEPPLPQLNSPPPPFPHLHKLFPSLLQPLLSRLPPQLPLLPLLVLLDQQLGQLDQLYKQRDHQLYRQREILLEKLHQLQVECAQWLQQWLQRLRQQSDQQSDQQLDQQLNQQLNQQEELLRQLKLKLLRQQLRRLDLQRSTVLEMIARRRLELYNDKALSPDPVTLSLFLSPCNEDILNNSRRLILESFRSTPSQTSLSPPNTTTLEAENSEAACFDFFDSKAVGDLTKWRLLASVVLPEWETLSTYWKDRLAAELIKVDGVGSSRVDWMARVTPLLEGEFNLYEFGLSDHDKCGYLTPTHLHLVATAVEHLGAERLARQTVHELENFLERYSNILDDKEALTRIRTVIKSQLR